MVAGLDHVGGHVADVGDVAVLHVDCPISPKAAAAIKERWYAVTGTTCVVLDPRVRFAGLITASDDAPIFDQLVAELGDPRAV